jgi:hypothetical protein
MVWLTVCSEERAVNDSEAVSQVEVLVLVR